ncbi:MAG TPA: tyrosine--tRNA ligase [Candidatus Saccharimonadales bacterium]|nr:tyrosine--tRNA ligase [Candidatus Saccharimonadales bacterium]
MAGDMETPRSLVDSEAIDELTTRAVAEIYPSRDELVTALQGGRPLRAYMGIDPTAPDMHVGHESQLLKLRRLQDLGHEVILLLGDFTATIGDPSDKSAARQQMTREEVLENAEGYRAQAGKILDFDREENPIKLVYNSEWLGPLSFADVLGLASEVTVQQMLERSMFSKRIESGKPLHMHEMMYPLMQGYDSVAMGVDIEVGGSDQIFNMLVGTRLVRRMLNKQKYVIAGELLVDPSGKKIGKSEGNMITLNDEPAAMYQKVMLWGDEITPHALELCSTMPMDDIRTIEQNLRDGTLSGQDGKRLLARTIVTDLHGEVAALAAESRYDAIAAGEVSDLDTIAEHGVTPGKSIIDILVESELAVSRSAARHLLEAGAVRVDGEKVSLDWEVGESTEGAVVRVGKPRAENHRILKQQQ